MDHNFAVCPDCRELMRATNTMPYRLFILRRRQCPNCKKRIITYEVSQGMLERIPELREYLRKPSSSAPERRVNEGLKSIIATEALTVPEATEETTEDYLARVTREYEEQQDQQE